jgi:hypothetical protein
MKDFLKIKHSEILENIPQDAENHSFPYHPIKKCYRMEKRAKETGCAGAKENNHCSVFHVF